MPTPKKNEPKKKFIKRCIPYLFNNEPDTLTSVDKKSKQAFAICNSLYKKKESRIFDFETFVNEGRKEKLEIDKTIKKMKREDQLESGVKLGTKVIPNKRKEYKRKKKVNIQEED